MAPACRVPAVASAVGPLGRSAYCCVRRCPEGPGCRADVCEACLRMTGTLAHPIAQKIAEGIKDAKLK